MEESEAQRGAIVVGVADTDEAAAAVDWALGQARLTHQRLVLVHAIGDEISTWSSAGADDAEVPLVSISRAGLELLTRALSRIASTDPELQVTMAVCNTGPGAALTTAARDADVLVVGAHHEHAHRTGVLDPIVRLLQEGVSCPISEVGPSSTMARPEILVVVAGTVRSRRPLKFAFQRAALTGLPVTVAVVAPDAVGGAVEEAAVPSEFETYLVNQICDRLRHLFPAARCQVLTTPGVVQDCLAEGGIGYQEVILEEHQLALVASGLCAASSPHDAMPVTTVIPADHSEPDLRLFAGADDAERQAAVLLDEMWLADNHWFVGPAEANQPALVAAKQRHCTRSRTVD